jgi:hypothetical protein
MGFPFETDSVPVALCTASGTPWVVCSDGAAWWYDLTTGEWMETRKPIPGTRLDRAATERRMTDLRRVP